MIFLVSPSSVIVNFVLLIIDNGSYGSTGDQPTYASNQMTIIVCKCVSGNIPVPMIKMSPIMIRERFTEEVRSWNGWRRRCL